MNNYFLWYKEVLKLAQIFIAHEWWVGIQTQAAWLQAVFPSGHTGIRSGRRDKCSGLCGSYFRNKYIISLMWKTGPGPGSIPELWILQASVWDARCFCSSLERSLHFPPSKWKLWGRNQSTHSVAGDETWVLPVGAAAKALWGLRLDITSLDFPFLLCKVRSFCYAAFTESEVVAL